MDFINTGVEEQEEMQRELKKIIRKKKLMRFLISIVLLAAVLLVGIGAAWMAGRNQSKDEIELLREEVERLIKEKEETPDVVDPVAPQILLDSISKEVREIGELATVEYLFTNAAKYSDSKQIKEWNIPLTEKSFTIKWDGVIKAGIQVDQIKIDLDESEKKIIVTIPAAEILSYDIDEDSVEVLDETDNKFNPITVSDKVKFDAETEKEMKERAIENGILEKAQKSAEKIINGIITSNLTAAENYSIEFQYAE